MKITINNVAITLPSDITNIARLAEYKNIPVQGTAIALNGKLIKADKWCVTPLSNGDTLLVISAAYGG